MKLRVMIQLLLQNTVQCITIKNPATPSFVLDMKIQQLLLFIKSLNYCLPFLSLKDIPSMIILKVKEIIAIT